MLGFTMQLVLPAAARRAAAAAADQSVVQSLSKTS